MTAANSSDSHSQDEGFLPVSRFTLSGLTLKKGTLIRLLCYKETSLACLTALEFSNDGVSVPQRVLLIPSTVNRPKMAMVGTRAKGGKRSPSKEMISRQMKAFQSGSIIILENQGILVTVWFTEGSQLAKVNYDTLKSFFDLS